MTTAAIAQALTILRTTTDTARRLHPELGLSFGYIGNIYHNLDDRAWSVFAKLSTRVEASACNVNWGSAATSDLPALAAVALTDLIGWADRQALRLAQGELFQVRPASWLAIDRPMRRTDDK